MRQAVQEAFVEGLDASWYKYCHCEQCHTRRLAEEVLQVRGARARARAARMWSAVLFFGRGT